MTGPRHDADARIAALVEDLATVEERLDPDAHARHRRTADLITVLIVLPVIVGLDWHAEAPLLMLAAMVGGLVLNRIPQWFTRWRLRREQERLFEEYGEMVALAGGRTPGGMTGLGDALPLGSGDTP